jgi:hypothetical protein
MATQQVQATVAQIIQFPAPSIDSQIEAKIDRYMELKALNSEYNRLQKELKGLFENTPCVEVGKYSITGSLASRNGYTVESFSFWDMKIQTR